MWPIRVFEVCCPGHLTWCSRPEETSSIWCRRLQMVNKGRRKPWRQIMQLQQKLVSSLFNSNSQNSWTLSRHSWEYLRAKNNDLFNNFRLTYQVKRKLDIGSSHASFISLSAEFSVPRKTTTSRMNEGVKSVRVPPRSQFSVLSFVQEHNVNCQGCEEVTTGDSEHDTGQHFPMWTQSR